MYTFLTFVILFSVGTTSSLYIQFLLEAVPYLTDFTKGVMCGVVMMISMFFVNERL